MIPEVAIIAFLIGMALKGKPGRLADPPIRHFKIIVGVTIAYIAAAGVNQLFGNTINSWVFLLIRICGMIAMLVFVVLNRHILGAWLVAVGVVCNLAAIAANGFMPVSQQAVISVWGKKSFEELMARTFVRHHFVAGGQKLAFLCDNIAAKWPPFIVKSVYSVGDVLLSLGMAIAIIAIMRTPNPKKETPNEA